MARLRRGDDRESCFEVLDRELRPRLRRYFASHGFGADGAADLVQETLLRVYRGVDRLRADDRLLPWLFTVARNVRLDEHSRAGRERAVRVDDDPELAVAADPGAAGGVAPTPEDAELAAERRRILARALEALPPMQRRCVLLRVDEELSYEEIGALLRISPHTVRNHLAAARRSLSAAAGELLGGIA